MALVCRKGMAVLYVDNGRCPDGTVDYSLERLDISS